MNVAALREKIEKTREKKAMGRESTGDRFLRGCVLPFCGRSGGNTVKNDLGKESARNNWGSKESQQPF